MFANILGVDAGSGMCVSSSIWVD